MTSRFALPGTPSTPVFAVTSEDAEHWVASRPPRERNWLTAQGFSGGFGAVCLLPGEDGAVAAVAAGLGGAQDRARKRFALARVAAALPEGAYRLAALPDTVSAEVECLGWLFASYHFSRYHANAGAKAQLVAPDGVDAARLEAIAAGEFLARDLINTPSSDMGPAELQAAAEVLADEFGAKRQVILGDDLLSANFPMIHAVGRASARPPRLIELNWGETGPKLTLVGKGVCFDTGGLNLKPGTSMGLMKKDMGGAANVLGLARMIMALDMPVRLRVLIPAVENSVSGSAVRPGDILTSRKGLTVEINNTDAEGRLVLADALALAAEDDPDLIISMATLTGAARVAVGGDIAPFFTDDDALSGVLEGTAGDWADPVWRLPFHEPYESMIEPGIADLDNAPKGGFGGAITAALFLRRFVGTSRYAHFDIYGWQAADAPGRPKGGLGQGIRALLAALPEVAQR